MNNNAIARQAYRLGWSNAVVAGQGAALLRRQRRFIRAAQNNANRRVRVIVPPRISPYSNDYSGEYIYQLDQFALARTTLRFNLRPLERMFTSMIQITMAMANLSEDHYIQVGFHDGVQRFFTMFLPVRDLTPTVITHRLSEAMQSNTSFDIQHVRFHVIWGREARGGHYAQPSRMIQDIMKKKCVIAITNADHWCFFYALAIGLAMVREESTNMMMKGRNKEQHRKEAAQRIIDQCHFEVREDFEGVGLSQIGYFEDRLQCGIAVIDMISLQFIRTPSDAYTTTVYLLYHDEDEPHYHLLNHKRAGALWNKPKFCRQCLRAYGTPICPSCKQSCPVCKRSNCESVLETDKNKRSRLFEHSVNRCKQCRMHGYNYDCLTHHNQVCANVQRPYKVCATCNVLYPEKKRHRCRVEKGPIEYVEIAKKREEEYHYRYLYYDFECTLDDGEHIPALIVSYDADRETFHEHENATDFVNWLCSPAYRGYTVIGHNASKYDFHFIKKVFLENHISSEDLGSGGSILYSYLPKFNLRFLDSMRFMQFGLRKFAKTFGFEEELCKGYFPYTFFTKEHRNYCGPMPPMETFCFDRLSPKEKVAAERWYQEHAEDTIDLWQLCKTYCKDDVHVLARGCEMFRKSMWDVTGINPFDQVTIAGTALRIYRTFHMPERSIAVLPAEVGSRKFAYEAEHVYGEPVCFIPCYDSGCASCFGDYTLHKRLRVPMITVRRQYNATHPLPPNVRIVKECEWIRARTNDMRIRASIQSNSFIYPFIDPRDAFFGGRTEVFKMYSESDEKKRIRYLDVTSLYPTIQFGSARGMTASTYDQRTYFPYPIGKHQTLYPEDTDISRYFGIIRCTVRSPENLYLPVLPVRHDQKLIFGLGTFTGSWCSNELQLAVRVGYEILKIYEVWHYEETSTTLFHSYVSTLFQMKQNAYGWDRIGIVDPELRAQYCVNYEQETGIAIQPEERHNPGMYLVAKLLLNSLWGKLAQRSNYGNTVDVFDYDSFAKVAFDVEHVVERVILHNATARSITYRRRFDCVEPNTKINIVLAAFTTAWARCRLYEAMSALQEQLLYCDTDSVLFEEYIDQPAPLVTGPYLGDLTDELEAGDYIEKFVATAPKSYSYITHSGQEKVKLKGFTLDSNGLETVSFQAMKELVDHTDTTLYTKPLQFDIDAHHNIRTRQWEDGKAFSYTFKKRKRKENEYTTVPLHL